MRNTLLFLSLFICHIHAAEQDQQPVTKEPSREQVEAIGKKIAELNQRVIAAQETNITQFDLVILKAEIDALEKTHYEMWPKALDANNKHS